MKLSIRCRLVQPAPNIRAMASSGKYDERTFNLAAQGIELKDSAHGTTWVRA